MMDQSDNNQTTIRPYRPGDEKGLAALLHQNFPNAPEPERIRDMWRWQFQNGFSRKKGVAVAQKAVDLVAQYAVMWVPMTYGGQILEGTISTATVTDRAARGQGLFPKLAARVYRDIADEGAGLVYGFPNSQSIKGFIEKLEWFEIGPFPIAVKPVDASAPIRKAVSNRKLAGFLSRIINGMWRFILNVMRPQSSKRVDFRQTGDISDEIGSLWKTSIIAKKIAIVRSREYLVWRYLQKPDFPYDIHIAVRQGSKPCGYAITHTADKFGIKIMFVMELIAERDDAVICQVLLNGLERIAQQKKASVISMLLPSGTVNRMMYLRNGYLPVPRCLFPQDIYWGARVLSPALEPSYVREKRNWHISWGDLDVV